MDNIAENIIAIRKKDISKANEAFADFMSIAWKTLVSPINPVIG